MNRRQSFSDRGQGGNLDDETAGLKGIRINVAAGLKIGKSKVLEEISVSHHYIFLTMPGDADKIKYLDFKYSEF